MITLGPRGVWCFGIDTNKFPTVAAWLVHRQFMKDESKLIAAFLVLNFSVVALAVAAYQKSGMDFGAVLSHLRS